MFSIPQLELIRILPPSNIMVCHFLIANHYTFLAHQCLLKKSFPLLFIYLLATTLPTRQSLRWNTIAKLMLKTYKEKKLLYPESTKSFW